MVTRPKSHVIDTKAVRKVESALDANWLIRSQADRDYGIDLALEKFDGKNPTGQYVFVQVKGHEKKLKSDKSGLIKFKFPVDTLYYAEMFKAPFFALIVSLEDGKIYFVSLKNYIKKIDLDNTHPSWRTQKHVNLDIPLENDFHDNFGKFEEMVNLDHRNMQMYNVMECYYRLCFDLKHWKCFSKANFLVDEIEEFLYLAEKTECMAVHEMFEHTELAARFSPSTIRSLLSQIKKKGKLTERNVNDLKSQIGHVQNDLFTLSSVDQILFNGTCPY